MRMNVLCCVALLLSCPCLGCGEDEAPEEPQAPPVGLLELPISHRAGASEPANAARIEVAPTGLGLDGSLVLPLQAGKVPEAERQGQVIAKLQTALRAGASRRAAALRLHVNTPYETLTLLLATLKSVSIHEVAFQVRKVTATTTEGWLDIATFDVKDHTNELVEHEAAAQRRWNEFTAGWQPSYDACRSAHYVDCAYVPAKAAEGGNVEIRMFTRGTAIKAEFTRFGGPEPEPAEGPPPEMLDGIAAPEAAEQEPPPATGGAFTWRFAAATEAESPVSMAFRPLCGARVCGVVASSDTGTPVMRTITFLGAAFPDGAQPPHVIFLRGAE